MPTPKLRPVTLRMAAVDWRQLAEHAETEALCAAIAARHGVAVGELARTLAMAGASSATLRARFPELGAE